MSIINKRIYTVSSNGMLTVTGKNQTVTVCDSDMVPLESFYQWDLSKQIKITGLGLKNAPYFMFYNSNSTKKIAVTGTMADGIVSCHVPDSLLEEALSLVVEVISADQTGALANVSTSIGTVYADGYESSIAYTFRIPVIPQERPEDYETPTDDPQYISWAVIATKYEDLNSKYDKLIKELESLPRDEWSASVTYKYLSIVTYDYKAYVAKQEACGWAQSPENTEYWMRLMSMPDTLILDCGTSTTVLDS